MEREAHATTINMVLQHVVSSSHFLFHHIGEGDQFLGWIRDPYEQIGVSPTAPLGFGKQARQTVGTGTKCVTRPCNKLSGLIVSIH